MTFFPTFNAPQDADFREKECTWPTKMVCLYDWFSSFGCSYINPLFDIKYGMLGVVKECFINPSNDTRK